MYDWLHECTDSEQHVKFPLKDNKADFILSYLTNGAAKPMKYCTRKPCTARFIILREKTHTAFLCPNAQLQQQILFHTYLRK